MAKRRKTKKIKIDKNFVGVVVALIIILFAILESKGVISQRKIRQSLGLEDKPPVNAQMSVHFIDVGQGDCILIISDGEAMLIDAGEKECGVTVADYLKSQDITELKYVIGTHPHSDHIGGLAHIIKNFKVENVILPKTPKELTPTTKVYEDLLLAVKNKGLKIHTAKDEILSLGESTVEIFAPQGEYTNLNNYSVSTKVTHGENTFLFTGDTEGEAEQNLVKRKGDALESKVLKLGHHGSTTASKVETLDKVKPRYAVVSCGKDNKYGHPHDETVDRVNKYADYLLRTDIDGTIIFQSDKKGLSVTNIKGKDLLV